MIEALEGDQTQRQRDAEELSAYVLDHFSVERMVDAVINGYRAALARARVNAQVPAVATR